MNRYFLVLSLLFLSIAIGREAVELKRANTLNSFEENGVKRQELDGDVWIVKDTLSVTCQHATYYPDSGVLIFKGNVTFHDPSRILMAENVRYNERTEEVEATGDVRIYQDTLAITSKRAIYRDRFGSGYFYDNVRLRDDSRGLVLTGDQGFFDHHSEYARVTGDPALTERDSSRALQTEIKGDTIEYFGEQEIARALGNVEIFRDSLTAYGKELNFFKDSSYAELTGTPHAIQQLNNVSGDTLRLHFEKEKLEFVEVLGHAVATSPADSGKSEPLNRMEGKKMSLWIEDSKVTQALVEDNAIATYHIRENGAARGLDKTSGDKLRIFFSDGRISRIRAEGGTQGEYLPEQFVKQDTIR